MTDKSDPPVSKPEATKCPICKSLGKEKYSDAFIRKIKKAMKASSASTPMGGKEFLKWLNS
jgi:hypothetical protein